MILKILLAGIVASEGSTVQPTVVVFVQDRMAVPGPIVVRAINAVTDTFRAIGIRLVWHPGKPKRSRRPDGAMWLQVTIESTPPAERRPVVAYCAPYAAERSIRVRYDQVRDLAPNHPEFRPLLLARILAHEVAHVLAGTDHHAEAGVMKAHWSAADCAALCRKPIEFSAAETERIRLGIARSSP